MFTNVKPNIYCIPCGIFFFMLTLVKKKCSPQNVSLSLVLKMNL